MTFGQPTPKGAEAFQPHLVQVHRPGEQALRQVDVGEDQMRCVHPAQRGHPHRGIGRTGDGLFRHRLSVREDEGIGFRGDGGSTMSGTRTDASVTGTVQARPRREENRAYVPAVGSAAPSPTRPTRYAIARSSAPAAADLCATQDEIAQRLGTTRKSVERRLSRVRARAKKLAVAGVIMAPSVSSAVPRGYRRRTPVPEWLFCGVECAAVRQELGVVLVHRLVKITVDPHRAAATVKHCLDMGQRLGSSLRLAGHRRS
ncbi:hypothetical protein ACF1G0_34425 [Streptomyces sp. NPDC013953]|uniref:hypothetical protein n=1 Tax=Streptomyces sp. NPDC013953 TaxID=3364868 RepID=UPI0036F554F9